MAGNAHRNRRKGKCPAGCKYCNDRPKVGKYSNKNGHRRNPARGKRNRKKKLNILI